MASLSAAFVTVGVVAVRAQIPAGVELPDALATELDEERAWEAARGRRHIEARELAEAILERDPQSFIAHFVLGWVHHYGEGNFPRALYYENRALGLFVAEHGSNPEPPAPWRWHARILRELAFTHGDLEHYEEQLAAMARYSELYEPDFIAERAWPFMKLRRFDDAREAARLGQESGLSRQIEIAHNALCAIEFEAGDDLAAYEACQEAMELGGADPASQGAVDFTNFAEAARSVFRFDEAERTGQLATEAQVSWYGNPWGELAELYVREGRFAEALQALRRVPEYRAQRPPHVRDSDRNEGRRALASFFLTVGRAEDAVTVSQKALAAPDRRAHQSRDPAQDRAIAALLHRGALRLRAERSREDAAGGSLWDALVAFGRASYDRWTGWMSGRVAARNLADDERLVGTFMIGTHRGAVMPPWLAVELIDVLGPGVVDAAIRRAREADVRPGAEAYYDAFGAEVARASGDLAEVRRLATRALSTLDPAEALLRGRMHAISAQASRDEGELTRAVDAYGAAFQTDPGVFRRLGLDVPVRIDARGELAADIASDIVWGPRFADEGWGLTVSVSSDGSQVRSCLLDAGGSELACSSTPPPEGGDEDEWVERAVADFHEAAFAPRVDLSSADANSLDGSNRLSRNPLETLLGPSERLDE